MKVILLSDVKNVGKKGQIVEVSDGYARNFLIRNKVAVEATKKSLEILDDQKEEAKEREIQEANEAREIAKKLEDITVHFQVKTGNGGKVFGAVSSKQIVDELEKKHGIKIDKRKFVDCKQVDTLGYTKVKVELHKGVEGIINVHLIEQK